MAPDLSFTKKERLQSPGDFKRVCTKGKRVRTRCFVVYALPNGDKNPRLGLTVSARTANSPGRARIKRLLREFFRLNKALFSLATEASSKVPPEEGRTALRELPAHSDKHAVSAPPGLPAGPARSTGHTGALDVVISVKTPAATLGLKDVEEKITEALSKLNRAFL